MQRIKEPELGFWLFVHVYDPTSEKKIISFFDLNYGLRADTLSRAPNKGVMK